MNLRISTAGLHAQGLNGLLQRQQELARTQQEMISGTRINRAADDPAAASNAQRLDHAVAALEQYDRNSGLLEHRLRLQEGALEDAGDNLRRARELAIQANNAALSPTDRALLAAELRELHGELVSIANRDDGNGRQLFAGSRDGVTPFSSSGGRVEYAGDDGQNLVDVAAGLAVADTDAGSDVFMRARTGDGEVFGSAAAANTGSGVLQSTAITDHAAWNRATLRVEFTTGDSYRVLDAGGTELATGTWQSGESIDAGGARITLTGAPAAGDAFTVERAPTRDVFASVKALADALEAPAATAAERARRDNVISGSIADLGTAQDHMLSLRASTGARLASLDSASDTRGAEEVSLSATLSQLRDVDYAKAATQLALHATALEAAQRTIVRVQSLSLFDRLG